MIDLEYNPDWLILIPTIAIGSVTCEDDECDLDHGIAFELSWLFWTLNIGFPKNAVEEE